MVVIEHDPDSGCAGCPFHHETTREVGDDSWITERACGAGDRALDDYEASWAWQSAPSWCPLRSGPVTVRAPEGRG